MAWIERFLFAAGMRLAVPEGRPRVVSCLQDKCFCRNVLDRPSQQPADAPASASEASMTIRPTLPRFIGHLLRWVRKLGESACAAPYALPATSRLSSNTATCDSDSDLLPELNAEIPNRGRLRQNGPWNYLMLLSSLLRHVMDGYDKSVVRQGGRVVPRHGLHRGIWQQ